MKPDLEALQARVQKLGMEHTAMLQAVKCMFAVLTQAQQTLVLTQLAERNLLTETAADAAPTPEVQAVLEQAQAAQGKLFEDLQLEATRLQALRHQAQQRGADPNQQPSA